MTRFFLHFHDPSDTIADEEGIECADLASADALAVKSIRSIVAEDVLMGVIDLGRVIEIADVSHHSLREVQFRSAFDRVDVETEFHIHPVKESHSGREES